MEHWIAAGGILFIFLMTTLGASMIFFQRKESESTKVIFLGFAGGVMLAASIFSLLLPAVEYQTYLSYPVILPIVMGILVGAGFVIGFDRLLAHMQTKNRGEVKDRSGWKLLFAMTIHNIPEGLAVGLTFGLALSGQHGTTLIAAWLLALGIGIQNFPEGAASSLPMLGYTKSKSKAFLLGAGSGIVEPIFATIGFLLATSLSYLMPFILAFGAGAMLYVVIDELIVCTQGSKKKEWVNIAFILGFIVMMSLDIVLG